eukprot:GEMP01008807.1.p1 GENE.GEMP01008807.1~~GEMP01008807.1.p1  ORF type:complete len:1060 (+),score=183.01 GEMP01008807.1:28-3180(+)
MGYRTLLSVQRMAPSVIPLVITWKLWSVDSNEKKYHDRRAALLDHDTTAPSHHKFGRSRASYLAINGLRAQRDATSPSWSEAIARRHFTFLQSSIALVGQHGCPTYCEIAPSSPEETTTIEEDVAQMGDRFLMKRMLKRGETTRVYECIDNTLENKVVAVKVVDVSGNSPSTASLKKEVELVMGFIKAGKANFFVPIYYYDESGDVFVLAMEFCSGDDLCEKMGEMFSSTDEVTVSISIIRALMLRMFACLECLHSQNLAHLDIKPDNFIFSSKTSTPLNLEDIDNLKLIDLSGCQPNEQAGVMDDVMATLYYAAPELLQSKETDLLACDIWSMGVIFYILLTQGCYPVTERDIYSSKIYSDGGEELQSRIDKVECPDSAKELLARMMSLDERKRPTVQEIVKHPFFQSSEDEALPKLTRRMTGTFGRAAKVDRRALIPYNSMLGRISTIADYVPEAESETVVATTAKKESPASSTEGAETATPTSTTDGTETRARRASVTDTTGTLTKVVPQVGKAVERRRATRRRAVVGGVLDAEQSELARYNRKLTSNSAGTFREFREVLRQRKTIRQETKEAKEAMAQGVMPTLSMSCLPEPSTTNVAIPESESAAICSWSARPSRRQTTFSSDGMSELVLPHGDFSSTSSSSSSPFTTSASSSSAASASSADRGTSSDNEAVSDTESIPFNYDNPLLVSPWERVAKREADERVNRALEAVRQMRQQVVENQARGEDDDDDERADIKERTSPASYTEKTTTQGREPGFEVLRAETFTQEGNRSFETDFTVRKGDTSPDIFRNTYATMHISALDLASQQNPAEKWADGPSQWSSSSPYLALQGSWEDSSNHSKIEVVGCSVRVYGQTLSQNDQLKWLDLTASDADGSIRLIFLDSETNVFMRSACSFFSVPRICGESIRVSLDSFLESAKLVEHVEILEVCAILLVAVIRVDAEEGILESLMHRYFGCTGEWQRWDVKDLKATPKSSIQMTDDEGTWILAKHDHGTLTWISTKGKIIWKSVAARRSYSTRGNATLGNGSSSSMPLQACAQLRNALMT